MYVKYIVGNDDVQCNFFVMETHCNEGWSCSFSCH